MVSNDPPDGPGRADDSLADAIAVYLDAAGAEASRRDQGPGKLPPLVGELRRNAFALAEGLDYAPMTVDMEFMLYLQTLSRFGFFRFGPVTIDTRIVEDLFYRTAPRGTGGPEHPPVGESFVRFNERLWAEVRRSGRSRVDELHYLLAFMRTPEGLPARVFGELGVTAEDVEDYVATLATHRATAAEAPAFAPGWRQRSRDERLYTTEEAAAYYGVHVQTVRTWIRSGKLPAVRLAGKKEIRIREHDLQAVLEPIDPRDT